MRKQAGLSLIELMIAITLGLVLMAGVMQVFISSRVTFSTQQAMSRVQETGRLAIEFMSRDLRMAGYMGCASRAEGEIFVDTAGDQGLLHKDFDKGLQGFTAATVGENLVPAPKADTDLLVVRTADALPLLAAGDNEANSFTARVGSSAIVDDCSNGICVGDVVAASNCIDARVFEVDALTVVDATKLKVSGGTIPAANFTLGAELIPVKSYVYYISRSSGDHTRFSLWQNVNGSVESIELLEGVEDMSLTYGRDGESDYVAAAAVTDWSKVNSVRIELLTASIDDNVLSEKQAYTFAGTAVAATAVPDRRLRQVFTATVGLRSNLQ